MNADMALFNADKSKKVPIRTLVPMSILPALLVTKIGPPPAPFPTIVTVPAKEVADRPKERARPLIPAIKNVYVLDIEVLFIFSVPFFYGETGGGRFQFKSDDTFTKIALVP